MEIFNQLNSEATANGAEFVGSVLFLSVGASASVRLNHLVQAMQANSEIPASWIPEPLNHLSLYLQCISGLNRASITRINPHAVEALPDTHAGYSIHRLHLRKDEDMPTAHKVFAMRKVPGVNGKLSDVEVDEGIIISLRRTYGDASTDKTGQSEFSIDVQANGRLAPEYEVFVDTLIEQFRQVRDTRYNADQIRVLLVDLLRNQLKATPIKRGDYFVEGRDLNMVESLREVFCSLDENIKLNPLHICKFKAAPTLNQSFTSLAESVQESVLKEMRDFIEELNHLENKEGKTRASTWQDRHDRFLDLQIKVKRFQSKQLIESDILTDLSQSALEILAKYEDEAA